MGFVRYGKSCYDDKKYMENFEKMYAMQNQEKEKMEKDEEIIDDGLGILITKKIIYHGSDVQGISRFTKAIDATVGNGIYFTSEADKAEGYAQIRSSGKKDVSPVVYEASIENVKLLDLRNTENIQKILPGFKKLLMEQTAREDTTWWVAGAINTSIEAIDAGKITTGRLKEVVGSHGELFTQYVQSLGYDGVIALEGGEGEIGNHDTYLIFDPDKINIIQEHR